MPGPRKENLQLVLFWPRFFHPCSYFFGTEERPDGTPFSVLGWDLRSMHVSQNVGPSNGDCPNAGAGHSFFCWGWVPLVSL